MNNQVYVLWRMVNATRDVFIKTSGSREESLVIEEIVVEPDLKRRVRFFQVKTWMKVSREETAWVEAQRCERVWHFGAFP